MDMETLLDIAEQGHRIWEAKDKLTQELFNAAMSIEGVSLAKGMALGSDMYHLADELEIR